MLTVYNVTLNLEGYHGARRSAVVEVLALDSATTYEVLCIACELADAPYAHIDTYIITWPGMEG